VSFFRKTTANIRQILSANANFPLTATSFGTTYRHPLTVSLSKVAFTLSARHFYNLSRFRAAALGSGCSRIGQIRKAKPCDRLELISASL
jgi:hypothetical protein